LEVVNTYNQGVIQ